MKLEKKINILNHLNLEQFLNFLRNPVAFYVSEIDVSEGTITINYLVNYPSRPTQRKFSIDSYLESNKDGFLLLDFLYNMVNLTISEDENISEVVETKYYTADFIENALLGAKFLFYDGYLEPIKE